MKEYEVLRNFREYRGKTQKEVADKLNMTHSGYSKYERGERKITLELWLQLMNVLNMPFNVLSAAQSDLKDIEDEYWINNHWQYDELAKDIKNNKSKLNKDNLKNAFELFKSTYERVEAEKKKWLETIKPEKFEDVIKQFDLDEIFKDVVYK